MKRERETELVGARLRHYGGGAVATDATASLCASISATQRRRRSADPYTDTSVSVSPASRAFMYASTRSRVR